MNSNQSQEKTVFRLWVFWYFFCFGFGFNIVLSTRVCVCWEVNRVGWECPSQQRFSQSDLAGPPNHPHIISSSPYMHIFYGGAPGVKKSLSLDLLWTLIRDFQTLVERVRGREQMSSFQQKLALKGSETSIEHFASVLKDVKDRGGWNTASALVNNKGCILLAQDGQVGYRPLNV